MIDLLLLFGLLLWFRALLARYYDLQRLDEIHMENMRRIETYDFSQGEPALLEYPPSSWGSYIFAILCFHLWTYKQFYPRRAGE